ncbi:MAG: RNA-binding S4 domain-containing protein [Candidatus Phytoplasma sp.]|nr:RNA-binding S4 domain-containing protein [Phytoplasma sp.]
MQTFILNEEYITITQFLKINDYISSGGQAKFFLLENEVLLNEIQVTQRKKKLFNGDVISINKKRYVIGHD